MIVDDTNLISHNSRPSFLNYLKSVWEIRHFVWYDARGRSFQAGRGTFLGRWWILLNPLAQLLVYLLVFGLILKSSRGIDNFVGFLVIGVTFFGFFSQSINQAAGLIQKSRGIIVSFDFPKVSLVFSQVVRQALDNMIPAVVAVVIALIAQGGEGLSFRVLLLVPVYFLYHVFLLACALFVSRATAFVPDLKQVVGVVTRALFFLSGIFYSLERFDSYPLISGVMRMNPIYQFLEGFRSVAMGHDQFLGQRLLFVFIVSVALLVLGLLYFWQAEERYAGVRQ